MCRPPSASRGSSLSTFSADIPAALPGPPWLQARRREAFERFRSTPLPTEQAEIWRYSRVSDLDLALYEPLPADRPPPKGIPDGLRRVGAAIGDHAAMLVLRNGRVAHAGVRPELEEKGVVVGSLLDLEQAGELPPIDHPDGPDPFVDLNTAFAADIAVVAVPPGVVVDQPIVVLHWVDADKAAVFPHLVVRAGEQSQVTIVDYVSSDDVAAYVDPVVEVTAGAAANVGYVSVQELGPRVWQTGHLVTTAGRDATVRAWLVALGGEYARLYLDAELPGQGGVNEAVGVYFGEGTQVHDFRSFQRLDAPRAASNFLLKGAVVDEARGVYTGLIRIEAGAKGTESFLTNRNLVLSEGARVDSVPNLEIVNENDLKNCGHASATGPVDDEQIFYLEARGVPTDVAQRLVVLGFFAEVLEGTAAGRFPPPMPVPGLRVLVGEAVAAKFRRVDDLG